MRLERHPGWAAPHNLAGRFPRPVTDAEWRWIEEQMPGAGGLRVFTDRLTDSEWWAQAEARRQRRKPPLTAKRLIYGLVDPRDGEVRYVGQTVSPADRLYAHRRGRKTAKRMAVWVASLREAGVALEMVELEWCTGFDATRVERFWIERFWNEGAGLLNTTGVPDARS